MVTEVQMIRKFNNCDIKQRNTDEYFCATDLVNADDDSSRTTIESINDSIMATDAFCNLVIIRTAMLIFSRLQNNNAAIYAQYYESNLRVFIESDIKSMEAFRGQNRNGGHYNLQDGLINDEGQGFFNGGLF